MESWIRELRHAARRLAGAPAFSATITLVSIVARAAALWPDIGGGKRDLVTTDLVLAETQTLLASSIGPSESLDFTRRLLARPQRIVWHDRETTVRALDWMDRFADRALSLTDAVSFAVMEARRIREAFTFDRHFEDAGFVVRPGVPR